MTGYVDITNKSAFLHSVSVEAKVSRICEPLKLLGIPYFIYLKILRDGTYINVCNGFLEYQKKYFENITSQGEFFISESQKFKSEFKYCIWPLKKGIDIILDLLYEQNMYNGFSLYYRTQTQLECFCFALGKGHANTNNFFINHIDKLHQFADYFRSAASDIIDCTDKSKLAYYKNGVDDSFFASEEENNSDSRALFKNSMPKKIHLPNAAGQISTLSQRETQCMEYLAHGKTFKEIALLFNISPRTIEYHIANIKHKLNVQYKSELIDIFWKNHVSKFCDT